MSEIGSVHSDPTVAIGNMSQGLGNNSNDFVGSQVRVGSHRTSFYIDPKWKKIMMLATPLLILSIAALVIEFGGKDIDERGTETMALGSSNINDVTSPNPSTSPSEQPTTNPPTPEPVPTYSPSTKPSSSPSISSKPSRAPSYSPTISVFPSAQPSSIPSTSSMPSVAPSDSPSVSSSPSVQPSSIPSVTAVPSDSPSESPTNDPTRSPTSYPTKQPTPQPTPRPTPSNPNCFTSTVYDSIDNDIALLKDTISNTIERSHFLGGIVRLAAHDFMDYDRTSPTPYGADGCFDSQHQANAGLPEEVWCSGCLLNGLYETKYKFLSRADFWIAAANAVIRQTSVNNALDLRNTFKWGRKDVRTCPGSGDRVPSPAGCDQVEGVFLDRMGLTWTDAVALMGAHAIGRGSADNSGHEGTWSANAVTAMVFDKSYFKALGEEAWRPRNPNESNQDWTLDRTDSENPRMMLNTDLCLIYDIEARQNSCCANRGECRNDQLRACPRYDRGHDRREALIIVNRLGRGEANENSDFYEAFATAWQKSIDLGWENQLFPLDVC